MGEPTLPDTSLHTALRAQVAARAEQLTSLARDLHAHPETAFEEHRSAAVLAELFQNADFRVERGTAGLPTAFTATAGPDDADLTIGFCLEYDALPGLGHACGHNIIAAAGAGAALALAAVADDLGLRVKALGTPAEESGGGKIHMLRAGAFDDVSCALMTHPGTDDEVGTTSLASRHVGVTYTGRAAHAAVAPHEGVNAADACVVAQTAIGLLRQHLPDGTRLHGIVTEGGARSNIVPERARMSWQFRSGTHAELEELWPRVRACFAAGALATGCELTLTEPTPAYADLRQDTWLSERYAHHARLLGRTPRRPASVGASTDMGNISHVMPSIHPTIGLGSTALPHTSGFAAATTGPAADRAVLDAALTLAGTAADLAQNPERRAEVVQAHRQRPTSADADASPAGRPDPVDAAGTWA
ncbi:N-acetyldiaminopimelate deacetylase [Streptomyces sp. RB17]|uniref:amidohydrolase n=1 Tax=Streptomyces sp. RB17 TaxID=2585197 RepID=UPI001295E05D|nr:amidohydrolase [Streptomyces sp. RB17]MQY34735.1 N-acetyldiaminopimelate deacetylase [Streptomyces sp. RB17]